MTESRYSIPAIVVHWLTAAALLLVIALGLRMSDAGGAERERALALHISLGVCVLSFSIFRIVLRRLHRPPPSTGATPAETWLAQVVHRLLYVLLIAVPLLGWLSLSTASDGTAYRIFGFIPWPRLPGVEGESAVGEIAQSAHRFLAYLVCALLLLHVAGALRHHLRDPQTGLARILPGERAKFGWRSVSAIAILALLFAMGGGYADSMLPRALRMVSTETPARPFIDPRKSTLFASLVQPILEEKCVACHGGRTQKAGLRLDSFAALSRGGEGGKVVETGKAHESELVRRLMLPKSNRDAMPPAGKTMVAPAEAQLVLWWIGAGADDQTTIVAADPPPLVWQILRDLGIRNESPVFAEPVASPRPEVLARLRESFQLNRLYAEGGFMRAQVRFGGDRAQAPPVVALAEIAEQLVWLDLSGTGLTDEQLNGLDRLKKLQRLSLASTKAGDGTIMQLRDLRYLEVLNLYDSAVSDAALDSLARMPSLTSVYLSRTAVTAAGVERFSRRHPRVNVVWQPSSVDATVTKESDSGTRREKSNAQSPRPAP